MISIEDTSRSVVRFEDLLPRAHKNKPSDFAGAWVMSNEEEGEIKKSLKELWRAWKVD